MKFGYIATLVMMNTLTACSVKKISYPVTSSPHALIEVFQFHIDEFQGRGHFLLKDILISEIYRIPNFEYSENYPTSKHAAIISANVLAYSAKDQMLQLKQQQVRLVSEETPQKQQFLKKTRFKFIEVPHQMLVMHRTLELQIQIRVKHATSQKMLYQNLEKIAFQQSYFGKEQVSLAPNSNDEIERLGRLLMKRFLDKLNPALQNQTLVLESGASSWVWGLFQKEHSGILKGNRYALEGNYEQAVKTWSYVTFFPSQFGTKESFTFDDEFYEKTRMAQVPSVILDTLLPYHGQTLSLEQINALLPKVMTRQDFIAYANIIKIHARQEKNQDNINLASAHYNLGVIYQIQGKLELASYHFAQANAYHPQQKYAQSWTDTKRQLGTLNLVATMPTDAITPPKNARIQTQSTQKDQQIAKPPQTIMKPFELPVLIEENKKMNPPQPPKNEELPQLNLD